MSAAGPAAERGGRAARWLVVGLVLLVAWAYRGTFDADFVDFDDDLYVTATPWTHEGLTVDGVVAAFTRFHASNWHPLTLVSHMLDVELFGLDARWHHLVNVAWHAANAALLFLLLRAMTGSTWRSALVAALFAVHPLRVESVAWISERKDVLSTFLALATLGAYLRYARRPTIPAYLLVAGGFSLALMAKAMVVTLPCVLLLLDHWPLRRAPLDDLRAWLRLVVEKVPLLGLSAAVGWATVAAQGRTLDASGGVSLGLRLSNAAVSAVDYVSLSLWPSGLAVFYPFPASIPAWRVGLAVAVLAALTAAAVLGARRAPWWTTGWLWFLGTLVPVLGLLRVGEQAMADRYTYLPSIGLSWAIVWGGHALLAPRLDRTGRRVVAGLVASAVLALAVATSVQVGTWRDSETLWRRALAVTEDNDLAHLNLAEVLRADGRTGEAIEHYRAALEVRDDLALAHAGLAQALRAAGDLDAAIGHLQRAVALDPRDARFRHVLSMALGAAGRLDEAEAQLRALLVEHPDAAAAYTTLGDLEIRRGDLDAAIEHYRAASRLEPDHPEIQRRLALLLDRQSRHDDASAE